MSSAAVSVVVPTYQRPGYLRETLQSILSQTWSDLEVLVVSDGPSEETENVVRELGDGRVVSLSVPHHGWPAPSRNAGIARARGEFIAFCDDDDLWERDKLEAQLAALRTKGAALCFTNLVSIDPASRIIGPRKASPRIYDRFPRLAYLTLPGYYIAPSSVLVPKRVVTAVGGFDDRPLLRGREDAEWFVRIAYRTRERFVRVPRPLVRYRTDPSRPGIGLQAGSDHVATLLEAVKENAGMSARTYARYAAVQWLLYARAMRKENDVLELLDRADRYSRTLVSRFMRMTVAAQRRSGAAGR